MLIRNFELRASRFCAEVMRDGERVKSSTKCLFVDKSFTNLLSLSFSRIFMFSDLCRTNLLLYFLLPVVREISP